MKKSMDSAKYLEADYTNLENKAFPELCLYELFKNIVASGISSKSA